MKFHRITRWSLLVLMGAVLAACSTTETRRKERSESFGALSADQQKAVLKGRIVEGLTHDGVYIALGEPLRKRKGVWKGKQVESWVYGTIELYTMPAWRYTGFVCRDGRTIVSPEYYPETQSRMRDSLVIFFDGDKVIGWQEL